MHIRKNDLVEIIAGDDKSTPAPGRSSRCSKSSPKENKIIAEGVNRVYKHLKPSAKNQQGGRLSKEMPIAASNALVFCSSCNRGVRLGARFTDGGQKVRYCKACNNEMGNIGPAKIARTYPSLMDLPSCRGLL